MEAQLFLAFFSDSTTFDVLTLSVFFQVVNGRFTVEMDINEVYTLTTLTVGSKGSYGNPPPAGDFPVPYTDDFQSELV